MSSDDSMFNIGDLAKPITVFIEKCANAAGVLYEPRRIEKRAIAEGKALLIKTQAEIESRGLQRRAYERLVAEECRRQENMEAIEAKAIEYIENDADPSQMEDDWIANFFDKCRLTSDEEMQELWAKVLAGEANAPGSFSKRTVGILSSLESREAILFRNLCGFMWSIDDELLPVIHGFPPWDERIYKRHFGLTKRTLVHLDTIGLILLQLEPEYPGRSIERPRIVRPPVSASYFGKQYRLDFNWKKGQHAPKMLTGVAVFTEEGAQLAPLTDPVAVEGFEDFIVERWQKAGYRPSQIPPSGTGSASAIVNC